MVKSKFRLTARILVVSLITCGYFFSQTSACRSESGKAYVSSQDASTLYVFDLNKNRLEKSIPIFTPGPADTAIPPSPNDVIAVGNLIFMTVPGPVPPAQGIDELKVIDSRSDILTATIKTGKTPSGLFVHEGLVYVVNRYGGTIQVVDPVRLQTVRNIPYSAPAKSPLEGPLGLAIVNGKIYLPFPGGQAGPGIVQVLDLKTGALLKSVDFSSVSPYGPLSLQIAGKDKLYLGGTNCAAVLNTTTENITKIIPLSGHDIAVQSFAVQNGKVYAASGMSVVTVVDPITDTSTAEIDIGYHAYATHLKVGIAAGMGHIYVADAGRGLKIIDANTDTLALTIPTAAPVGPLTVIPGQAGPK